MALEAMDFVISFCVITFLFAMIFKLLPDVHVAWRDVWLGAALSSSLFSAGKVVIGLYLGRTTLSSAYGPPAPWSSSCSGSTTPYKFFFLGAEFTKVSARRRGIGAVRSETAAPLARKARAEQGMAPRKR